MTENTTPTLLEAARALAMARERLAYLRELFTDNLESAKGAALVKRQAWEELNAAEAALDAAYRAEEYGEDVE